MAVSQAPACGPACERSIARKAGGIEGNMWSRKKTLRIRDARRRHLGGRHGSAGKLLPGGARSSPRPRAVTCFRLPFAQAGTCFTGQGTPWHALSILQGQGCVWRAHEAHQPKPLSKPRGRCEQFWQGPTGPRMRAAGRCFTQGKQRLPRVLPSMLAACPIQLHHALLRTSLSTLGES